MYNIILNIHKTALFLAARAVRMHLWCILQTFSCDCGDLQLFLKI
jgi:hypothetical protein